MIKILLDQTIPLFTIQGFDIIQTTETLSDTQLLTKAEQQFAWLYTTSRNFLDNSCINNPGIAVFEHDAWSDYGNWYRNGILDRAKKFAIKMHVFNGNTIILIKSNGVEEVIN